MTALLGSNSSYMTYVIAFFSILASSAGQVFLKMAVRGRIISLSILSGPDIYIGFFLYALSAILWILVLSKLPLAIAYPLVSLNFIFIMIAGWLFLREPLSWNIGIGGLLIVAGIITTMWK